MILMRLRDKKTGEYYHFIGKNAILTQKQMLDWMMNFMDRSKSTTVNDFDFTPIAKLCEDEGTENKGMLDEMIEKQYLPMQSVVDRFLGKAEEAI
jgi:hypothetical protein